MPIWNVYFWIDLNCGLTLYMHVFITTKYTQTTTCTPFDETMHPYLIRFTKWFLNIFSSICCLFNRETVLLYVGQMQFISVTKWTKICHQKSLLPNAQFGQSGVDLRNRWWSCLKVGRCGTWCSMSCVLMVTNNNSLPINFHNYFVIKHYFWRSIYFFTKITYLPM